MSASFESWLME